MRSNKNVPVLSENFGLITPKLGIPFLQSFNVQHGAPSLLGRYFLTIDKITKDQGIYLGFTTFDELVTVYDQNADNWGFYNPMFDPRTSDVNPNQTMCLVGRNSFNEIVGSASAKFFDATKTSFGAIIDADGFYSLRSECNPKKISTRMRTPVVDDLHGLIGYCGGAWVHPDYRHRNFSHIYARTISACISTLWNPDYIVGAVKREVIGTRAHTNYGFAHFEPSFTVLANDQPLIDLVLLWMDQSETAIDLARFLDVLWPKINAAIGAGDRQKLG
jgi:hypothetical protein